MSTGKKVQDALAALINVAPSDSWSIVDFLPAEQLCLVDYNDSADLSQYGKLRGVVIDLKANRIIARSYGFTPSATLNILQPDLDKHFRIRDNYGLIHDFPARDIKIYPGLEGKLITLFKHNEKVYIVTHRRLNIDNLDEHLIEEFNHEIYNIKQDKRAKNSTETSNSVSFFNPNKKYSSHCYHIMAHFNNYFEATKAEMLANTGYFVYLGSQEMFTESTSPYPVKDVDFELVNPDLPQLSPTNQDIEDVFVRLGELNLEDANYHLQYGYYDKPPMEIDPRLLPGEFIVLYSNNVPVLRVNSPSYAWRLTMTGGLKNTDERFYALTNGAQLDTEIATGLADYEKRFPLIKPIQLKEVKQDIEEGTLLFLPSQMIKLNIPEGKSYPPTTRVPAPFLEPTQTDLVNTRDERLYNIFLCYLLSVPLYLQKSVVDIYPNYLKDRAAVINWLRDLELENVYPSKKYGEQLIPRVIDIISSAREELSNFYLTSPIQRNQLSPEDKEDFRVNVLRIIRNTIPREEGLSLYRIVLNMRALENNCFE
jgi:hypothetical protein